MKWIPQDMEMFMKAKEYVDTVVIPLYPISFGVDVKETANSSDFVNLLTNQLERQFKGRVLLLPGFAYFKKVEGDKPFQALKEWETILNAESFKHVVYVTSDSDWKLRETELSGSLIWLPALPLEHLDEKYKNSIIDDQVKQLMKIFVQKWHDE